MFIVYSVNEKSRNLEKDLRFFNSRICLQILHLLSEVRGAVLIEEYWGTFIHLPTKFSGAAAF